MQSKRVLIPLSYCWKKWLHRTRSQKTPQTFEKERFTSDLSDSVNVGGAAIGEFLPRPETKKRGKGRDVTPQCGVFKFIFKEEKLVSPYPFMFTSLQWAIGPQGVYIVLPRFILTITLQGRLG